MKFISNIKSKANKLYLKIVSKNTVNLGNNCCLKKGVDIHTTDNGQIDIGDACFINKNCSICAKERITIGERCLFGENVKVYDSNHRFSSLRTPIAKQGYNVSPISIGANCWIGSNTVILKGVKIGDNVIIGANCVITENIPSNMIVKNVNKLDLIKRIDKI